MAWDINNHDQIVGTSFASGLTTAHGILLLRGESGAARYANPNPTPIAQSAGIQPMGMSSAPLVGSPE